MTQEEQRSGPLRGLDPEQGDGTSELGDVVRTVRELLVNEEELSGMGLAVAPPRPPAAVPAASPRAVPAPNSAAAPAISRGASTRPGTIPMARAGPIDRAGRQEALARLAEQAAGCSRCRLHAGRTKSVFARGDGSSGLCFVGEGPGYHEDQQGLPFVGAAGELLDKMITAMGQSREHVYVCNVVKCRPPDNRTPLPDEVAACADFLKPQLAAVAPRIIVALGRSAAEALGCAEPGSRGWRGSWSRWQDVPVMSTYHPAFLLRSPQFKRQVWQDLQTVMQRLSESQATA